MLRYKQIFTQYLDIKGVNYTEPREDVVKVVYSSNNLSSIPVFAFFDKDGDNMAEFKCFDIINMKDKESAGILACNELNTNYRWVKFYLDEDADIICDADMIFNEANCGEVCENIMDRMADIIEKSFPTFAKAKFVQFKFLG